MKDPISPLAVIAIPTIAAGYKEHNFVIEAVASEGRGHKARWFHRYSCERLSLDLVGA